MFQTLRRLADNTQFPFHRQLVQIRFVTDDDYVFGAADNRLDLGMILVPDNNNRVALLLKFGGNSLHSLYQHAGSINDIDTLGF